MKHVHHIARKLAVAAVATLASVSLAGCAGFGPTNTTGTDKEGKVTVRFSYLWTGDEAKAVEKIIKDFNASQSKISVKGTSSADQQAQVLSMQGKNPQFDISNTGNSQIVDWANSGVLLGLDDYIKADKYDTSDFLPAAIKNNSFDSKLYALPVAANIYQLLYNKDELKEAGITNPPETFDDFAKVIDTVSKLNGDKVERLGTNSSVDLQLLVQAYGGSWYTEDGKASPTNPRNIEALNWWVEHVVKKFGAKNLQDFQSGFGEYGTAQYPFYTGQIATLIDGNWQSAFIRRLAPKLNWGAAALPYPADKPELRGTTRLDLSNLFIPKNSAHPKEAWKFMKYFLGKKPMLEFTHTLANLPGRTSLLSDTTYSDLPNFDVFLAAAKSKLAVPSYSTKFSTQYGQDLSAAFTQIQAGQATPEQAMQSVAEKAKAYKQ
nr:ABC transporter substrate-binding protein [Bifidobacterium sp. M0353]